MPIRPSATGGALEIGAPEPLFVTRVGGALQGVNSQQYTASPDGRFLMNTVVEASSPLTVILNWAPPRP